MTSETQSRGHGRQRSRSVQERSILTIAELRELQRGRAILFASGTPAAMIEPQPRYGNRRRWRRRPGVHRRPHSSWDRPANPVRHDRY